VVSATPFNNFSKNSLKPLDKPKKLWYTICRIKQKGKDNMTYKAVIHTKYDNGLLTCIINHTKHFYYESVTVRDVYETNDGMAMIFSAHSPHEIISAIMESTPAKFEVTPLGFVDGWKVKFGMYIPKDKKEGSKIKLNK